MINLVPQEGLHEITRDYQYRRVRLFLSLACLLFVSSIIMLVPVFIDFRNQAENMMNSLTALKERPISKEADVVSAEVTSINALADKIGKKKSIALRSEIVKSLINHRTPLITFRNINISDSGVIGIEGQSGNREALRNFIKVLEQDSRFKEVTSPISSLIESKDIAFTVNLNINDKAN